MRDTATAVRTHGEVLLLACCVRVFGRVVRRLRVDVRMGVLSVMVVVGFPV